MTDVDDWSDPYDDNEPDDDWRDDDGYREPDPEDAEIARAYAEHAEHCERKHGGGECHCRPSLLDRLRACRGEGEGWFYIKTGEPDLRPEGYDGVALCGCGSAVTKLAEDRRYVRQARNEPPF